MKKLILLLIVSFGLVSCTDSVVDSPMAAADKKADTSGNNLVDLVVSNPDVTGDGVGDFSVLLAAVQADAGAGGNVLTTLGQKGQLTVFAPTDAAFVALLEDLGLTADQLLANTDLVGAVLAYHVAHGRRYAADVITSEQIRMLDGNFASISEQADGYYINESKIIATDVETSNGIVHVINAVLLPPTP